MSTLDWIILAAVGAAGVIIAANWQQCSQLAHTQSGYLVDSKGNVLASGAPCVNQPCTTTYPATTPMPAVGCLLNPFGQSGGFF